MCMILKLAGNIALACNYRSCSDICTYVALWHSYVAMYSVMISVQHSLQCLLIMCASSSIQSDCR